MSEPIRLSKRLIELVGCSRREAELFIEGGWVTVDGEVIDEPQFKVDNQKVELDPEAKATAPEPVTILLNAPAGLDTDSAMALIGPDTLSEEHRFGKRPLKGHFLRLSVGNELQANASGLLRYLPLLLVPAAVGVMVYAQAIVADFWAIVGALVLSLLLSLLFTGWLMHK